MMEEVAGFPCYVHDGKDKKVLIFVDLPIVVHIPKLAVWKGLKREEKLGDVVEVTIFPWDKKLGELMQEKGYVKNGKVVVHMSELPKLVEEVAMFMAWR